MLQATCSKPTRATLDKIQNHALRFISGAMRSTPTAACEIHTNVEPLDLRREAAVMEGFERFKRLDPNHPNRKLVESKRPNQRLKQNSILDIAENLKDKYKLPENREQKCIFDQNHPPHKEMKKAQIKLDIDGTCTNKKDTVLGTLYSTYIKIPPLSMCPQSHV